MCTNDSSSGRKRKISLPMCLPSNKRSWRDTSSFGTHQNTTAENFIEGLRDFAHLVTDLSQVTVVIRDPNDDMVIATAQRAQAAYIVTRDKDLLSLHHYEGITMITPEAFIAIVREWEARRSED